MRLSIADFQIVCVGDRLLNFQEIQQSIVHTDNLEIGLIIYKLFFAEKPISLRKIQHLKNRFSRRKR